MELGTFITGLILSCLGLILNTIELVLLYRHKTRKTKYQHLIQSLSAADICASLFFMCLYIIKQSISKNEAQYSAVFVTTHDLVWFAVSSSLLHVLAISFDRLLAVRFPLKHRFWFTHKKNTVLIVVIWVLSFLFVAPTIVVYLLTNDHHLTKLLLSSLVLVSGFMIVILYAYIIRKTVSKDCIFEIITLQSGKKEVVSACSPREKRILQTSVLIVVSFFACSFPFAVLYIAKVRNDYTTLLLLSNSILNPMVYFYQRYYKEKKEETLRRKAEKSAKFSRDIKMQVVDGLSPKKPTTGEDSLLEAEKD